MRALSILLNIVLLIIVVSLMFTDGWPRKTIDQLIVTVFFFTPIISAIALLWSLPSSGDRENWLSLFLERKKLEEKVKLKKLRQPENET